MIEAKQLMIFVLVNLILAACTAPDKTSEPIEIRLLE